MGQKREEGRVLDKLVKVYMTEAVHARLMRRLKPNTSESEIVRGCIEESIALEDMLDDMEGEHSGQDIRHEAVQSV